jgi:DNA-directed RNA polymerase specialized sigma24 family protein
MLTATQPGTADVGRFLELIDSLEVDHREAILALTRAGGSLRGVAAGMGISRWAARKRVLAAVAALTRALGLPSGDPEAVLHALLRGG